jgi:hypothetical protein
MSNKRKDYINKIVDLDKQVVQAKQDTVNKDYEAKIKNIEAKADKKIAEAENKAEKETKKAKSHKVRNTLATIAAISMITGGAILYNGKNDVDIRKDNPDDSSIVIKEDDKDKDINTIDAGEVITDYDYVNKNKGGKRTNNGTYDAHGNYTDSNGNLKDSMNQTHESSKNTPQANSTSQAPANVGTKEGEKSAEEYKNETDNKINNQVQNGGQKEEIGGGITVVTTPDNGNTSYNSTTAKPQTEDKSHVDATNTAPDTSRKVTGNIVEAPSDPAPSNEATVSASSTNTVKSNNSLEMSEDELEDLTR